MHTYILLLTLILLLVNILMLLLVLVLRLLLTLICINICIHIYIYIHISTCVYIYMVTHPTTRRCQTCFSYWSDLGSFLDAAFVSNSKKAKDPRIQSPKTKKIHTQNLILFMLFFWIFGLLEFGVWNVDFLIFGMLDFGILRFLVVVVVVAAAAKNR